MRTPVFKPTVCSIEEPDLINEIPESVQIIDTDECYKKSREEMENDYHFHRELRLAEYAYKVERENIYRKYGKS